MAEAGKPPSRPLSPHLSIWKPGPAMVVSILHRISGDGLALAYATLTSWVWSDPAGDTIKGIFNVLGKVVLVGLSWAFFEHLLSGLRHFVLDTGAGYELKANALWSWLVLAGSVILAAAFWAAILLGKG
jgi:succinate dehydrogenase / fumarate reductase cytochrome b subunit